MTHPDEHHTGQSHGAAPGLTNLDAARLLLDTLGVNTNDLLQSPSEQPIPTIAEYVPIVAAAVPAGTRTAYLPYWRRAATYWPHQRLDQITPTDIGTFAEHTRTHALTRRNSRDGRSAAEHAIAALRCLYHHAANDRHTGGNPARTVPKPRRHPSPRTALRAHQLTQIQHVAATTGNDPVLDILLLRLHIETACRRGGALNLRPRDLEPAECLIRLREKGGTTRWQPVSPTLMRHLQSHIDNRPPRPTEAPAPVDVVELPLLRYRNGRPITRRRYDHLWNRIGRELPWVATQQISTHWLRHTTLTWIERHHGHAIARAYAGHTTPKNSTDTYTHATLTELASALAHLTGETHPLAEL
jgi:integrase/recombinase XerC